MFPGKLLARQILSTCWSSILDVLSTLLSGKCVIGVTNSFAIMLGTEVAKEETLRKRDALCKCLDGLQTAAKLCCTLGMYIQGGIRLGLSCLAFSSLHFNDYDNNIILFNVWPMLEALNIELLNKNEMKSLLYLIQNSTNLTLVYFLCCLSRNIGLIIKEYQLVKHD